MIMYIPVLEDKITPAQYYRGELVNYLDKTGKFILPEWIAKYLPLLNLEQNVQTVLEIETLLNTIPQDDDYLTLANLVMNMILILIRIKRNNIIIL